MICIIAEIIAILAESYLAAHLLIRYFGMKNERFFRIKYGGCFLLLLISDLLGTFAINNEMFLILSCLSIEIAFAMLFLRGGYFEKIFLSIISYLLVYGINFPVLALISMVSNSEISELTLSQDINRIVCLFITKILYFAAVQFILWLRKKEKHYFDVNEWIIIVSVFLVTLLIGFAMYLILINNKISDYIYLVSTLLLSLLDMIIFVFMRKMNFSSQQKREQELMQLQLEMKKDEIRKLEEQYREVSILRHDFKNSIDCISRMIQHEKYEDALNYSQKLKERKVGKLQLHIECSSSAINAVVNSKFSDAQENGIDTSLIMVVQIPETLEFDISIILMNLLDNAIEACRKNEIKSQIILTISKVGVYYQLLVENTIEESVLKNNRHLKSIKSGKNKHGLGLKSIKDIVEKHDGMLDIYEENDKFYVSILLKEGIF